MQQPELFEPTQTNILSVSQITQYLRALMDSDEILRNTWVRGEISNLSLPVSGHIYFTLKDENSSLRCVVWKNDGRNVRRFLQEGVAVEAHGSISIYERSGQYQLYVDSLRPAGEGILYQLFLQLKTKLESEGLFDPRRKRPTPPFPRLIGIVTSLTGAALQDILNTLKNRFPLVEVVIAPTAVQGEDAPLQIVKALELLNRMEKPDVIIVARGGGSLEDLWAFNVESVVRAIADSGVPVITGIGHETDFTLADFAADLRAPTPTGAAVLATPDIQDLQTQLLNIKASFSTLLEVNISRQKTNLQNLVYELDQYSPQWKLRQETQRMDELQSHLLTSMAHRLQIQKMKSENLYHRMQSIDPLQVLKRGYAIVNDDSGTMLDHIDKVHPDQEVIVRLQDGRFSADVKSVLALH